MGSNITRNEKYVIEISRPSIYISTKICCMSNYTQTTSDIFSLQRTQIDWLCIGVLLDIYLEHSYFVHPMCTD